MHPDSTRRILRLMTHIATHYKALLSVRVSSQKTVIFVTAFVDTVSQSCNPSDMRMAEHGIKLRNRTTECYGLTDTMPLDSALVPLETCSFDLCKRHQSITQPVALLLRTLQ